MRKRTVRTHNCGELKSSNIGSDVMLCGWVARRRDLGGLIFLTLRDRHGIIQVVFDPAEKDCAATCKTAEKVRGEYVLWCKGRVRPRPEGQANKNMPTGGIEVLCSEVEILSDAKTPPFHIDDEAEVAETLRLKYRYLDLRRPSLQRNLSIRHKFLSIVRRHLDENGFLEIETPVLYKSTPEGARDFIVPSRITPGTFYALPQSPQTLKQLLMISAMDRYYQVARCFRDEDLRADRQPEFSQIDIETSFMDEEALFPVMEEMIAKVWKGVHDIDVPRPFPRMPYQEAMDRFGSDKPDVRFGLELRDVTQVFAGSEFQVFKNARTIRAVVAPGAAEKFSRKDLDELQGVAVSMGAKGLIWIKVQPDGALQSPVAKFFTDVQKTALRDALALGPGALVLAVADQKIKTAQEALGAVRLSAGMRLGMIPKPGEGIPAFLWVMNFPLLEFNEQDQRYYACHHPFTSPRPEFLDDFIAGRNLDRIEAAAYDMVLNGVEIGGGSLRIHREDVQAAMFRAIGLSQAEAAEKFGFFLEALQYGTPPHGGIAFGVDRIAAMLCGTGPIRDVIAFPKTQKGHCLMSESPSRVTGEQLRDLGIAVTADAAGGGKQ